MSRPWKCPVCKTVIILGPPSPDRKVRCPVCETEFTYPLEREANAPPEDTPKNDG